MKWDTPAFASVSSLEPAPIQKPIATERTLGIRSEMTRSPESSSERTYFCTQSLSLAGRISRTVVEAALDAGAIGARLTGGSSGGSVVALAERTRADAFPEGTLARAGTQGWIAEASAGAGKRATRRRTGSRRGLAGS